MKPARRRAPRWMWVALIISVAVNLLVIGAAAGAAWHFRYVMAMHGGGAPAHFGRYVRSLPEARRREIDSILRAEREVIRPLRRRHREARRMAKNAFLADPFDATAFSSANQQLVNARMELIRARQDLFPKIAEKLTAAERREFFSWRKRHRHRWRRWHERRGQEEGGVDRRDQ